MPGDEWYNEIHSQLARAESVWVLATPHSITRPWIYWEAGIGKATCPHAIVVVRVGLAQNEVPSPLSNFQSYDGLSFENFGELLGKVGAQLGMKIPQVLIDAVAKEWTTVAKDHKPEEESSISPTPTISPEAIGQLESILARLEQMVVGSRPEPPLLRRIGSQLSPRQQRRVARQLEETEREERLRQKYLGSSEWLYEDAGTLFASFEAAYPEVNLEFSHLDSDGDAVFHISKGGDEVTVWLDADAFQRLPSPESLSVRARFVLEAMNKSINET